MSRQFKVGDIVDAKNSRYQLTNQTINDIIGAVYFVGNGDDDKIFFAHQLTLIRAVDEPAKPYKGQFEPAILQFCVINEVMEAPAETELKNNVAIKVNKMLDNLPF